MAEAPKTEQMIPVSTAQAVPASQEDAKVEAARQAALAEQKKIDPKVAQESATFQNTHDPVETERLNNERMFAKDRIAREPDPAVEVEVHAKLISDAEKELADAQAKVDSAKATRDAELKKVEEREKEFKAAQAEAKKK